MKRIFLLALGALALAATVHADEVTVGAKVTEEADTAFFFKEADMIAYYGPLYFVRSDSKSQRLFEDFGYRIRWTSKAYEVTVISLDAAHHAAQIRFQDFNPVWVDTDCLDAVRCSDSL